MKLEPFTFVGLIVLAIIPFVLLMALAFQWFWNGTVVPTFDGVHELNYWAAMRLMLFIGIFLVPSNSGGSK